MRVLVATPIPAFVLANVLLAFFHEPWRDEAQPWLVARDAPNLFRMLDSETHPALWYLLAWPLAKVGLPFESLRVVHVAIAVAALAILVRHGPFSRTESWLYAFGYFVLYEYSAITRNYALVALMLAIIAATWRQRFDRPLLHGALLLLLANSLGHGTLLAGVLAGAYGIEWLARPDLRRRAAPLAALAIAGLGGLAAYASMRPAPDVASWRTEWSTEWNVGLVAWTAHATLHAFLPVPLFDDRWRWGATLLENSLPSAGVIVVGALAFLASALVLVGRPRVLAIYAAGASILLAFIYLKAGISAQARHHGLLFVWWVFCIWLARLERPDRALFQRPRAQKASVAAIVLVLSLHVATAFPAAAHDVREPFSGGQGAARYLVANDLAGADVLIGVYPSFLAAPILAHLPPRSMYLLETEEYGSYTRWTHEEAAAFQAPLHEHLAAFEREVARTNATRAILVLQFSLGDPPIYPMYAPLGSWGSISPGDAVHLYERVEVVNPVAG